MNIDNSVDSGIQTVVIPKSDVDVKEETKRMVVVPGNTKLQDLVDALNALQLPASDLAAVIRSIHKAGALHAQLVIV